MIITYAKLHLPLPGHWFAASFKEFENLVQLADVASRKNLWRSPELGQPVMRGYEVVGMGRCYFRDPDIASGLQKFPDSQVRKLNEILAQHKLSSLVNIQKPIGFDPHGFRRRSRGVYSPDAGMSGD